MDFTAPLYSVSATAAAAGLLPGYVRHLLADYRMLSMAAAPRRAARGVKLCALDALWLRVLRLLREAGLSEQNAIYTIDLALDPVLGGFAGCGIPVDYGFLRQRVAGRSFFVVADECDEAPDVFSLPVGSPMTAYAESAVAIYLEPILEATTAALAALSTKTAGAAGPEHESP